MFSEGSGFKAIVSKELIGIMVIIIIAVAVITPLTEDMIVNAGFTGTTAFVLGLVPLLVMIVILVIIVATY